MIDLSGTTGSVSTAEEALSDISDDEEEDDALSCISNVEAPSTRDFTTPDEDRQIDDMSIISSKQEEEVDNEEQHALQEIPNEAQRILQEVQVEHIPIEEPPKRVPIPAQQLPISQNVVQHQIFLCDCLCAFPTRGSLITHKAYCTTANY